MDFIDEKYFIIKLTTNLKIIVRYLNTDDLNNMGGRNGKKKR